jgi:phosphoglucosamine mutase
MSGLRADGVNINAGCGSTHMELIAGRIREAATTSASPSTETAIALQSRRRQRDGDDHRRIARDLAARDELRGRCGRHGDDNFDSTRRWQAGIEVATTDVGDRHVVELFRRDCAGRKQSRHIVDMRLTPPAGMPPLLMLRALGDARPHLGRDAEARRCS